MKKNKKIMIIISSIMLIVILITTIIFINNNHHYKVRIVSSDGSLLQELTIKKGDNLENVAIPEKEGYIFVSWVKDGTYINETDPIYENITITPKYTETPEVIDYHVITFNIDGEIKTQNVKVGEKIERPKDPKKDRYTFLGWYIGDELYNFDTIPDKDLVLIAKFKKDYLTITYDLNGGSGTLKEEIEENSYLKEPVTPTKFGYHFVRWTTKDDKEFDFSKKITEDTTLKAQWAPIDYVKVTFNSMGGNQINVKMIESGTTLEDLPIPTKEGYTFKYWSLSGEKFEKNIPITKDIILEAIYEKITN